MKSLASEPGLRVEIKAWIEKSFFPENLLDPDLKLLEFV